MHQNEEKAHRTGILDPREYSSLSVNSKSPAQFTGSAQGPRAPTSQVELVPKRPGALLQEAGRRPTSSSPPSWGHPMPNPTKKCQAPRGGAADTALGPGPRHLRGAAP